MLRGSNERHTEVIPHLGGIAALLVAVIVIWAFPHISERNIESLAWMLSKPGNIAFLTLGYLILLLTAIRSRSWVDVRLALTTLVLVTIVVHLFKFVCGDWLVRPSGHDGGFPSGHAAASFALAFLLSARYPKLTAFWYLFAVGIAWSRVELNAHYPYQVFGGAVIGYCLALLLYERTHPSRRAAEFVHRC